MQAFAFHCETNKNKYAISIDKNGSNIPTEGCKAWDFFKILDLQPNDSFPFINIETNGIIERLNRDGFCIITTSGSIFNFKDEN